MGKARIDGAVLDATMDMEARKKVFAEFDEGTHDLIAAPKLLDEGVDIPSADLAIILASSRSRRHRVQRMGRVIRPKKDGRIARIAVLYVEWTAEDPNMRARADFMELVTEAGTDVKIFKSGHPSEVICAYLNDMRLPEKSQFWYAIGYVISEEVAGDFDEKDDARPFLYTTRLKSG